MGRRSAIRRQPGQGGRCRESHDRVRRQGQGRIGRQDLPRGPGCLHSDRRQKRQAGGPAGRSVRQPGPFRGSDDDPRPRRQGPQVSIVGSPVKAVDAENHTIAFDDKVRAELAGKTFRVAPDAFILIDGKRGKLADLPAGAFVNLGFSVDRKRFAISTRKGIRSTIVRAARSRRSMPRIAPSRSRTRPGSRWPARPSAWPQTLTS